MLELDINESYGFIEYLMEKEHEEKLFFRWAVGYQDQMGFEDFKIALIPPKVKTEEEILDDVFDILDNYEFKGGELP